MMPHHCHLPGCAAVVPRRLFMCRRHWRMVSRATQRRIWSAYWAGERNPDGSLVDPSPEYLAATRAAIAEVQGTERELYT